MISELPPANMSSAQPMSFDQHSSNNNSNDSVSKSATSRNEVVRLVIISDTHGHHNKLTSLLPEGDILIHLGDFCNRGSTSDAMDFADWVTKMAAIPSNQKHPPKHALYEEIIVLEGNHDRSRKLSPAESQVKQLLDINQLFKRVASDTDGKVQFLQDQMIQSKRHPLKLYCASWNSCAGDNFPFQFDLMGQEPPDIMLAHIHPLYVTQHYLSTTGTYRAHPCLGRS
jgi:predicted phosphodiesterase